jgi:HEAT repeat protein
MRSGDRRLPASSTTWRRLFRSLRILAFWRVILAARVYTVPAHRRLPESTDVDPGTAGRSAQVVTMSGTSREPALPLPGLATVVVSAAGLVVGWLAWQAGAPERARDEAARRKEAIAEPGLSLHERLKSANAWVAEGRSGVPQLLRHLANPDPHIRNAVLLVLSRLGPEARQAGPAVAGLLGDPQPAIRAHAVIALRNIAQGTEQHLDAIVPLLDDPDESVRQEAFLAVSQCGPAAVDELLDQTGSLGVEGRLLAVGLLQQLGADSRPAVAAIRGLFGNDPDTRVRDQAFMALVTVSPLRFEEILAGLNSRDQQIVEIALGLTKLSGPAARPALPRLVELLAVDAHRDGALRAIAAIGPAAAGAVPQVMDRLHTADGLVNSDAIDCLARIATNEPDVLPTMTALLRDPEPWNVRRAARALRVFNPESGRVEIPRLVAEFAQGDQAARRRASAALVGLGPEACGAVEAMLKTIQTGDASSRQAAIEILGEIGPAARAGLPVLAKQLDAMPHGRTPGDDTRARTLLRAIRNISSAAPACVLTSLEQPLLRWLDRELDTLRAVEDGEWIPVAGLREGALALGRVAPGSQAAHRALCRLYDTATVTFSDNRYTYLCNAALWGMADVGACPDKTASLLLETVRLDDAGAPNLAAVRGLGLCPEQAADSVPVLVAALGHRDSQTRTAAALALGRLGCRARAAIPALKALHDEPSNHVKNGLRLTFGFARLTVQTEPADDPIEEYRRRIDLMSVVDAAEAALQQITASAVASRHTQQPMRAESSSWRRGP